MQPFEGFQRKAVVVLPTEEEFKKRVKERTEDERKEIPESAVLEMKGKWFLHQWSSLLLLLPSVNVILIKTCLPGERIKMNRCLEENGQGRYSALRGNNKVISLFSKRPQKHTFPFWVGDSCHNLGCLVRFFYWTIPLHWSFNSSISWPLFIVFPIQFLISFQHQVCIMSEIFVYLIHLILY